MSVRVIARLTKNYFDINREERNYAAILFATLCRPGNIETFLINCGIEAKMGQDSGVYFEYAALRDTWNRISNKYGWTEDAANDAKKEIIRQHLKIRELNDILNLPVVEINEMFGVGGRLSAEHVQYPGRWAIGNLAKLLPDDDDFRQACLFKWAFNVKPDIVIHTDIDTAACIEAKYESPLGFYKASDSKKPISEQRSIRAGQMEVQHYMMTHLLGIKTEFRLITSGRGAEGKDSGLYKSLSWANAFHGLDMKGMPMFALRMKEIITTPLK